MGDFWASDYWEGDYWEGDYWGATVFSPSGDTYLLADFGTGDTVTIDIYRIVDSLLVINGASMIEIGSTGRFKYVFSQDIIDRTEYLYITENGVTEQQGKVVLGAAIALDRIDRNTQAV